MMKIFKNEKITWLFISAFLLLTSMTLFIVIDHSSHQKQSHQVMNNSNMTIVKLHHYSQLMENTFVRTQLIYNILNTDELNKQEALNQELESYSKRYFQVIQSLKKISRTEYEQEQLSLIPRILLTQKELVYFAITEGEAGRQKAREQFYHRMVPEQAEIINLLKQLAAYQQEETEQLISTTTQHQNNELYKQNVTTFLILFITAFIIFMIIRLVTAIEKENDNVKLSLLESKEKLQNLVTERTQELEYQKMALDEHAIVSITDKEGKIIYVNEKFSELSGYTSNELLGKNHRIIKSGIHSTEFYQSIWDTISKGNVWRGEICNRRKDGRLYWVASTITPFLDKDKKPYKYVSIRTDISAVKAVEKILFTSQERLKSAQIFANLGIWDWNIQTGALYWSERISNLFGYETGELETTYENFIAALHPDDRQNVIDAVKSCIENGIPYEIEHRVIWPDGTVRWLLEKGDVIRDKSGKALNMLGVVQDIDVRKNAELALSESQLKLNGLYSLSPLGIALTDMQGNFLEFNKAFESICGYSHNDLKTLNYWELTPREYETDELEQIELLKIHGRYGPYEKVYRHKNGELIPIRLNGILIEDHKGEPRIWSIVEDITDIKRVEAALIQARDEAELANKAKSEFLSSMSHELRTPLNAILGLAQLYGYDKKLSEQHRSNAEEIIHAGDHLLSLINEILDLAKIESGHVDINLRPLPFSELLNECISVIEPIAESYEIDIAIESQQCQQLSLIADYTRLKQVILNLLSNAVKYNRKNGYVSIHCDRKTDSLVRISIHDTGMGISKENMDKLFQPFSRLNKEFDDIEGTGIGLVIVKKLIELMGGDVGCESKPGKGSVFWFELELARSQESDESKGTELTGSIEKSEDKKLLSVKILVAEDNKANQLLLKQQLELLKIDAEFVVNGFEAFKKWQQNDYDLLLTDINMPVMDGYELVNKIRREEQKSNTHIPIISITANAMKEDKERCLESGMDDFIAKPFMLDELNVLLKKWISESTHESSVSGNNDKSLAADGDPVDISMLTSMVGYDQIKHCHFLNSFIELTPVELAEIDIGLSEKNIEKIQLVAHKLKSSARAIGAIELADLCQLLETAAKRKHWHEINQLQPKLSGLFQPVMDYVKQRCHSDKKAEPLNSTGSYQFKAMIVDDDQMILDLEKMMLNEMGINQVDTAVTGYQALEKIKTLSNNSQNKYYDFILCDLNMPEMDGLEFIRHLSSQNYKWAIVLVSGEDERILRTAEKLATEHHLNVLGIVNKPITQHDMAEILAKLDNTGSCHETQVTHKASQAVSVKELEFAIENDQLIAYFQPKVSVANRQVVSMETLVRWQHPEKGIIAPDSFIQLAEEHELIDALTRVIFKQAIRYLADLQSRALNLDVAINLSVLTLNDLHWPDFALSVVKEFGIEPSNVTFEITENRLMDNLTSALEILSRLSMKKFKLSIDDFGTGYSSMEQIQRAPFSELKIDRIFVNGAANDNSSKAILESSVDLARKLNMKTVAEGVENQQDWDFVSELGCDEVQGYFIARPMPADEFMQWLINWEKA